MDLQNTKCMRHALHSYTGGSRVPVFYILFFLSIIDETKIWCKTFYNHHNYSIFNSFTQSSHFSCKVFSNDISID